jgi:ATP-binding cassette subfamily B protein
VWEAAPRRFVVSLAPQAVSAVIVGAQACHHTRPHRRRTRDLATVATSGGSGSSSSRRSGLSLLGSAANLVQNQQQSLLSAIVERHTNSVLLDRIIAIDLKRFETPEFQDLPPARDERHGPDDGRDRRRDRARSWRRADRRRRGRPVRAAAGTPMIAVIGFVPMWLASMATSRTMYKFFRSMTPNERQRSYVFNLFTQREYAKEIRAFGLAGYLRALYERLSNERLEELRRTSASARVIRR